MNYKISSSQLCKADVADKQIGNTASLNIVKKNSFYMPVADFLKTYHTYEYNRGEGTDELRAREIANSIINNETSWLLMPVLVDAKSKTILDGNTTTEAYKILHYEKNFDFEVWVAEMTLPKGITVGKAVQTFNNCRKGWTLNEYILNYIKEGYADYRRLQELADALGPFFHEDDKYRWRYTAALSGRGQQDALREGIYKLSKADYEQQLEFGKEVQALWEAAGSPKVGTWAETFILAFWQIKEFYGKNFNFNRFLEVFKTSGYKVFETTSLSPKVWKDKMVELKEKGAID